MTVYDVLLAHQKKESNASIHQKRKPNSAENSSTSESTEKQKDDTSKKDNMGENKKTQLSRVQPSGNLGSEFITIKLY